MSAVPPPPPDPAPVPFFIRCTHPAGFRSGQWARVTGIGLFPNAKGRAELRPCYLVEFVDGAGDYWPVYDDDAGYQFSKKAMAA